MKKIILSGLFLAATLSITSCDNKKTTDTATTDTTTVVKTPVVDVEETETEMSDEQKQEMVQKIDAQKAEIEAQIKDAKPMELKTTDLREQLKQKWEKIHFYAANGQVMRVKTYPYEKISKRTEEFYFQDGNLILAVIEDDGTGEAGKEKEKLSKLYYFSEGKPIHEINNTNETEYSVRESDAERLLEEANEYVKLHTEKM